MTVTSPYDYLVAAAREHADALALVTPTSSFTYAELRRVTRNIAGVLRAHGVRAGDVVATTVSADIEWILTLALIHEGVVTCSVWEDAQAERAGISLLITDTAVDASSFSTPRLVIDHAWMLRASDTDNSYEPVPFAGSDAVVRLVLTSGTTGTPKLARYTLGAVVWRNENLEKMWVPGVYLNLLGLPTMAGFYHGMAHLAQGMTNLAVETIDARAVQLVVDYGVNFIAGSPLNLGQLCDALEVAGVGATVASKIAAVVLLGSTPSDRIVEAIRYHLGVDATLLYGSTEGGAVTMRVVAPGDDPRVVGRPYPGVSLEIVDEHDNAVAPGETGFVRYRTLDMTAGYFGDPAATALAFRDGWFHPGDRGFLSADGQLTLAGRTEEILNVGGVKLDPLEIDRVIMEFAGVVDAAAFVFERLQSTPRLAVAVVGDASLDLALIDAEMRRRYPTRYPSVYVATAEIPRNAAGKVRRGELGTLLEDSEVMR
jgi:acyl-coenzyme A synthetase/AMP-(fatty) acid ligase